MVMGRSAGIGRLVRESWVSLAVLFGWDVAVVLVFQLAHRPWMDQPALPYSLIGSALVLFLNVRNNAAYNRWWEGRTLWGAVVNNSRSFARQAATLLRGAPELTLAMIGYVYALRAGLSGKADTDRVMALLPDAMRERVAGRRNLAAAVLYELGVEVRRVAEAHGVHPAAHAEVDRMLSDLSNAQGGLERIRNTPLAIQFSLLPGILVNVFCLVLPLSMVQELGWITPFGSTLVGFLFVALDKIGSDLESPFDNSVHAMPMLSICRTIEIDLKQAIGVEAPPPVEAVRGVMA